MKALRLGGDGFLFGIWRSGEGGGGSLGGGFFLAQCLEGAIDEPAEVPAVNKLVGSFAGCVVAAGQHARLEIQPVVLERLDHLERVFAWEGQVVVGVDQKHALVGAAGFGGGKPCV